VLDPAEAMFPAVEAPSNADLAAKISAETARTDEAVSSAQSAADTARNVAIVATLVAIVALGLAIASRRRDRAAA